MFIDSLSVVNGVVFISGQLNLLLLFFITVISWWEDRMRRWRKLLFTTTSSRRWASIDILREVSREVRSRDFLPRRNRQRCNILYLTCYFSSNRLGNLENQKSISEWMNESNEMKYIIRHKRELTRVLNFLVENITTNIWPWKFTWLAIILIDGI